LILRRPSAITNPGLYAEDGVIFWLESLQDGVGASIQPYNGYLHLIPRLIAALASVLPLSWTPTVFAIGSAVVSVACCALVLSQRFARLIPSYSWRLGLFALLLLTPRLTEVHLSLNSVLWWCGVALLLTSLGDDPTTARGRVAELVAVPILVLSGLAGVVLAPLAALRWSRTRSGHSVALLGVWLAVGAVQMVIYATQGRDNGSVPVGVPLARAALEKNFGTLALGQDAVDVRWAQGVPLLVLVMLSAVAAAWVAIVVTGTDWTYSTAFLWTVGASTVAGFMALGPAAAALPDRYTVLPIAAVLTGLVCSKPSLKPLVIMRAGLIVLFLALRVTDFTVPARPSTNWDHSVDCLEVIQRECVVELNPDGWTVTIDPGLR
jgi:hypothetical protein